VGPLLGLGLSQPPWHPGLVRCGLLRAPPPRGTGPHNLTRRYHASEAMADHTRRDRHPEPRHRAGPAAVLAS
jgi:hypothetical protein